ncbi:MAG: photosynthetic complex assembly protein [Rubellimicrobium sp.]|nr:photosynthetic complex assembly protein [Rubellimicrobium sp.]
MSQLETQMRHRDKEMVPRILVQGMFALMLGSVALVAYAQISGRPNVGVLYEAEIVAERSVVLAGDRTGNYEAIDGVTGDLIAVSSENKAGFIGVIGRVLDRDRFVKGVGAGEPVRVVRRTNGNIAIIDDATGMVVELIGYGPDNVAAFARMLD